MSSKLCPFCMRMTESDTCPHCGKNINYAGMPMHLPAGYVVSGTHPYVLGAALGQGGFGITYIALDMVTNERVAIKEYYPTYCSARTNNSTVTAYSNQEEVYLKGKERFLDEARTLKSLSDLKSIVNVLDFFEANNTAYLVMEFLEGSSLKDYAAKNGKFPAQKFLGQIRPLMEDIERMHQRGVVHRDIAPDNIMLLPDGQMKLIDFGAARSYLGDKSMTVVVKKGFAPVEQYFSTGSTTSSDVYALAATIYYCITGIVPMDSAQRQNDGTPLAPPSALGADITPVQEKALAKALEIQQKARTQSVQEFLDDLNKEPEKPKPGPPVAKPGSEEPKTLSRKRILVAIATVCVIIVVALALLKPHSHSWMSATCTASETCMICGKTTGVAAGHQWKEATCTAPKTCAKCGETYGHSLEHSYTDATCTEAAACKKCGKTKGTAAGHKWLEATFDVPETCKICGEIRGSTLTRMKPNGNILRSDSVSMKWLDNEGKYETRPVFGQNIMRDEIISITFLDTVKNAPADAWDLSEKENKSVIGWVTKNGNMYDLFIAGEGGVTAPTNCAYLFSAYTEVKEIKFSDNFCTENVTNMWYMFAWCESLKHLDLSAFDTSNVTDMGYMFTSCDQMRELDLKNFNTSKVVNMKHMFRCCHWLQALDVSSFETSKVTDMDLMFYCNGLYDVDLSNFNFSRVKSYDRFRNDGGLVNGRPWEELFEK